MKKRMVGAVLVSALCACAALPTLGASAASKPGVVYGGTTSQGAPVWVRLSGNRRSIVELLFDWHVSGAHCTNGRAMTMPENFDKADGFPPIKLRNGRFSGTIPEDVGADDGTGSERFTLAIKVTDATVRATFSARVRVNVTTGGSYDCTLPRTTLSAVN